MAYTLVLLRHGESEWNAKNLFTGWVDVPLSDKGRAEAVHGGELLKEAGVLPEKLFTSMLRRAIMTANLSLDAADRHWIPVERNWRLNERHYGALQGKNKKEIRDEYGEEQFMQWRRSYDVPPPPIEAGSEFSQDADPRYAGEPIPATECLKDVLERLLPYWEGTIVPEIKTGKTVMIAAHGNSLRAIVKHLDDISDDDIAGVNIPTGIPLVYELDEYLRLITTMEATHDSARAVEARVGRIGQLVSHDVGDSAQTKVLMLSERIAELTGVAGAELNALPSRLKVLHQSVTELRFSVALMRLLTLMVGRFAQSILDGTEVDAVHSLTDLCEALESGFRGLGPVLQAVSTQVAQLNDALRTVTSSLDRAARRLGQWVDLRGGGAGSSGSPIIDEVAQLTSRGFPEVRSLAELAAECRGLHLPYDENVAAQRLAAVRSALAELI